MELDRDFLVDWIDKPPSNTDFKIIDYILKLQNTIKDIKDYVNFLVIINQTINGKFSETQWGQDILGLIGDDSDTKENNK